MKGQDEGSGSRVGIKGRDQGSGSSMGIKDINTMNIIILIIYSLCQDIQ